MQKLYWVHCPQLGFFDVCFADEAARNEMALALWQEYVYFLTMRILNWHEDPIMSGIEEDASNNIYTWESEEL